MERAINRLELGAFAFLGAVTIISVLAAFNTGLYYLALIPFALIVAYATVINFKFIYFALLAAIPVSIEYSFSSSLGTDLPDEPLMVGLMLVTIVYLLSNYKALPTGFFANILMVGVLVYLFWIFVCAVNSVNFLVSLKVFLAKCWYVTAFCVLTAIVMRTNDDLKRMFWCIYIPLTVLTAQVLVRQGMQGFTFDDVNKPMYPFFRNHVNYAAILSVFFPFILLARTWYPKGGTIRNMLSFSILFYLAAIYLSYTRTSYIAIVLIYPFYIVIKKKWMKPALAVIAIGVTVLLVNLFYQNNYLKYAPTYEETIYHDDFGKHLSSTFEGKDVSSMERVYRWVAATRMFKDKPLMGFGPGNFYPYYMHYTLSSFETYVSDNPERSTTHNYPLLLLTEQGAIGLGIFLLLTITIFIYGEKIYQRVTNTDDKRVVMILLIVMLMIYVNLLLSDLLESDKVGPFFFICIALLVSYDIKYRSLNTKSE